ncbi:ABC transporter permease [Pseudoduganella ginsengisoli]|uniref:FtsX-like permease family protein n=1 Tax=Pseudoduganella ginsengisoli TaxID=1462440 RepID=A0A6L6PU32_9BURK|nr:ABC transporter permease [Pseudoduganella ginsengisoli]MTW00741.1 FtsX-like permease family protein [Pseudoduganella ginsengisoli]
MLKNYIVMAYKVCLRRKLYTALSLLCIMLTLVVLLVATALLQQAFHPAGVEGRSDRFLQVFAIEARREGSNSRYYGPLGYKVVEQYLKPVQSATVVSAVTMPQTVSVYQDGRVSELQMRRSDAEYWRIMDFHVLAGRVYTPDDVAQGRMVAVINYSTARKLFPGAGIASAVGRQFDAGNQPFQVIGVVEDALHLNALSDIWVPVTTFPDSAYRQQIFGTFTALLMADSPAGADAIRREVAQVARNVQFDDPKEWNRAYLFADDKLDVFARTITQSQTLDSGAGAIVAVLSLLAVLFMLLPALNLVNLNMGRIMERSTEIGTRKAFGATNRQLAAQLLTENIMLCLAGGLLSLPCAALALMWIEHSGVVPYLKVSLNGAVFGYGLLLTIVFGVLSGVIPAWKMSRLDPVHALKGTA